ncbi:MAG: nhaS3 1 [Planctomycetaceae bacterium]|nr:nhaS3 1 [Planctomycetaceae bacterium]
MLLGTVAAFFLIRHFGEGLGAVSGTAETVGTATSVSVAHRSDALLHILLALVAMIAAGRLLGLGFRYFGQPPVIGEVIAGILLGPSLLGRIAPEFAAYLLPQSVAPSLGIIAQLGVILYMFVVGLELDSGALHSRGHSTIAISHASIVTPFILGSLLALFLYPRFAESHVSFTVFALFLGAAMSVTAFPVLARILTDRGISRTPLGIVALTCAATDDVTAWCLLAFVVGVAQSQVSMSLFVLLWTCLFIAVMLLLVKPLLQRWVKSLGDQPMSPGVMAMVFTALLGSALITEAIGIHAIFGGFILGAIFPHDSRLARDLRHKLEDTVTVLLLPAFFAFTGMRTQIGLVSGLENWAWCGLIIAVATLGKFGGTLVAARLTGLGWRESSSLGILMNTRGLMELIALNIGLDLKIISPTVFAMLVIMAVVTTIATTPILQLIDRGKPLPAV